MKKIQGIYIGLGSNLGNRSENLNTALVEIQKRGVKIVKHSSVFETSPWGNTSQPAFMNLVAEVNTFLAPVELMELFLNIETRMGRIRSEKWGPRTIDIDILSYHQLIFCHPKIILPHPHVSDRLFVLEPWTEIEPNYMLKGKIIFDHLNILKNTLKI